MGMSKGFRSSVNLLAAWGTVISACALIVACNKGNNNNPPNPTFGANQNIAAVPLPSSQCLTYQSGAAQQPLPEPLVRCHIRPYQWEPQSGGNYQPRWPDQGDQNEEHRHRDDRHDDHQNDRPNQGEHHSRVSPSDYPSNRSEDVNNSTNGNSSDSSGYDAESDSAANSESNGTVHVQGNRFHGWDYSSHDDSDLPPPPSMNGNGNPNQPMTPGYPVQQPIPTMPSNGFCGCPAGTVPACLPNNGVGLTCVPVQGMQQAQFATWNYQNNGFAPAAGYYSQNSQANSCPRAVTQVCENVGASVGNMYCQPLPYGGRYGIWVVH
jgi:hypothetical protein